VATLLGFILPFQAYPKFCLIEFILRGEGVCDMVERQERLGGLKACAGDIRPVLILCEPFHS
jgi:hypothetical protein